jgi:hypothetical protein
MKQLLENLDYIRSLFNQRILINGQCVGRQNIIKVDDALRDFVDQTFYPIISILQKQECKDEAFNASIQLIEHLQNMINSSSDVSVELDIQSLKNGYCGFPMVPAKQTMRENFNKRMFESLPREFTSHDIINYRKLHHFSGNLQNQAVITRWKKRGLIMSTGKKSWKKVF